MNVPFAPSPWRTLLTLLVAGTVVVAFSGCDLSPQTYSTVTPDNFYRTPGEIRAATVAVYSQLEAIAEGQYWWDSQISTDESIIPTRGTDWDDGGVWRRLHKHSWTPNDPASSNAWTGAYTGIARANTVLANLGNSSANLSPELVQSFQAELRTLRAFFYYTLMDLFGGVPIVTAPTTDTPPARATRAEVFAFIEKELKAALPNLPLTRDGSNAGRVTQGAVRAILANMYLNAEVFTAKVTTGGLQGGTPMYQEAIEQADALLNSDVYQLADDFFANFVLDNYRSPEIIFAVQFVAAGGPQFDFATKTLHYNQFPQGCCNGLATLPSSYETFHPADVRREMFLTGRAYNFFTGEPASNRQGDPLIFTKEVPIRGASEGAGYRPLKWEVDPSDPSGGFQNDYAFFRLAEIYLIKAEALWRLNGPNQQSLDLINRLRRRAFDPDQLSGPNDYFGDPNPQDEETFDPEHLITMAEASALGWEQLFLDARTRELHSEGKRRQDLIRFGRFTSGTWEHKEPSEPWRVVFPIPQSQIDASGGVLKQNPGY